MVSETSILYSIIDSSLSLLGIKANSQYKLNVLEDTFTEFEYHVKKYASIIETFGGEIKEMHDTYKLLKFNSIKEYIRKVKADPKHDIIACTEYIKNIVIHYSGDLKDYSIKISSMIYHIAYITMLFRNVIVDFDEYLNKQVLDYEDDYNILQAILTVLKRRSKSYSIKVDELLEAIKGYTQSLVKLIEVLESYKRFVIWVARFATDVYNLSLNGCPIRFQKFTKLFMESSHVFRQALDEFFTMVEIDVIAFPNGNENIKCMFRNTESTLHLCNWYFNDFFSDYINKPRIPITPLTDDDLNGLLPRLFDESATTIPANTLTMNILDQPYTNNMYCYIDGQLNLRSKAIEPATGTQTKYIKSHNDINYIATAQPYIKLKAI